MVETIFNVFLWGTGICVTDIVFLQDCYKSIFLRYICNLYEVARNQMVIKLSYNSHMHTYHITLSWHVDTLKLKINSALLLPEENRNLSQLACIIFQAILSYTVHTPSSSKKEVYSWQILVIHFDWEWGTILIWYFIKLNTNLSLENVNNLYPAT